MGTERSRAPRHPRLSVAREAEALSERAASEVTSTFELAREARGVAHVALSGGTTPARTYELVAETVRDWRSLELWFADERCVPPDDEESNYRLVAHTLLRPGPAPPEAQLREEQIKRMEGELGPHTGAARYAALLKERLAPGEEGAPALDLAVLGIGPEGHIASLFPETAALRERDALCLGIEDSPKPPPERITLTMPVLLATRRCLMLVIGEEKAEALAAAFGEPSPASPASLLPRERLTVLADEAAAALIPPQAREST